MSDFIRLNEHLVQDGFVYAYAISAADLTGSGSQDLVVCDTNVGLYWLENDGVGNFTRHVIHLGKSEWIERHLIADIDGDGRLEIVCVDNINGCVIYFKCDGDPRETSSWSHGYISEGGLPGAYDVAVGDFDGDGDLDIAGSGWRIGNQFAWFENRNGVWVRHIIEEDLPETRAIRTADFDGDGNLDLLGCVTQGNELIWYRNPGDPRTEAWEKHVIDRPSSPFHGTAADIDGDGDQDVVVAIRGLGAKTGEGGQISGGQIVWYENDGNPAARSWEKHIIADDFPFAFEAVADDIDGDGQLEVVATKWGSPGGISIFKPVGDPKGPWREQVLKDNWPNATQPIIVDVDGDGLLDIVATSERGANEVRWWRNEGSLD